MRNACFYLQAQFSHIGSSLHHRTPYIMRVPRVGTVRIVFWLINATLFIVPQLLAYRCSHNPSYFLPVKPDRRKSSIRVPDGPIYNQRTKLDWNQSMKRFWSHKLFSRAASPERSDLSTLYGVCMYVVLWKYFLQREFFHGPQKIIGSQNFQNQNVFHIILSNFFLGTPPPPSQSVKGIGDNTRFGFIHVRTGENFFLKTFF